MIDLKSVLVLHGRGGSPVVRGEGPVGLEDAHRKLHAARDHAVEERLELVEVPNGIGVEVLAQRRLNGVGVVEDAARLHAHGIAQHEAFCQVLFLIY